MTSYSAIPTSPADVSISPDGQVEPQQQGARGILGRNRLTKLTAGLATGMVILAGVGKGVQSHLGATWESRWGTVEDPKVSIDPLFAASTFRPSTYREAATSLRDYIREELAQLPKPKSTAAAVLTPVSLEMPVATPVPPKQSFGAQSAEDLARTLVERTIGRPIPDSVRMQVGQVQIAGMGGFANSLTETATAEYCTVFPSDEANYYETVGTLAHEFGHLMFRYSEERFTSNAPWSGAAHSTSVREEAVAVLFRQVVAAQEPDPNIRFALGGNLQVMTERHLSGEKDYGLNEGAALCDAALTLADGDLIAAWNLLTTPGKLDPILYKIIEDNRALYHEVTALEENYSHAKYGK